MKILFLAVLLFLSSIVYSQVPTSGSKKFGYTVVFEDIQNPVYRKYAEPAVARFSKDSVILSTSRGNMVFKILAERSRTIPEQGARYISVNTNTGYVLSFLFFSEALVSIGVNDGKKLVVFSIK